jgi:trehalose-6-phosphate synthase
MVRVSHVGIDEAYFEELFKSSAFRRPLRGLRSQIKEMRREGEEPPMIITSIDSLHPITGIKNKLLSYYQFLKKYGDTYKRKVVLI